MVRAKHPKKEVEEALRYAESQGWRLDKAKGNGHAWGRIYCRPNDKGCRGGEFCVFSIYSTPKSPFNHADRIRRIVDNCSYRYEEATPLRLGKRI